MRRHAWIPCGSAVIRNMMKPISGHHGPALGHTKASANASVFRKIQTRGVFRNIPICDDHPCCRIDERFNRTVRTKVPTKHHWRESRALGMAGLKCHEHRGDLDDHFQLPLEHSRTVFAGQVAAPLNRLKGHVAITGRARVSSDSPENKPFTVEGRSVSRRWLRGCGSGRTAKQRRDRNGDAPPAQAHCDAPFCAPRLTRTAAYTRWP